MVDFGVVVAFVNIGDISDDRLTMLQGQISDRFAA